MSERCVTCKKELKDEEIAWDREHLFPHCSEQCNQARKDAYDDYVDPLHWYHGHNPDRMIEH